MNRLTRILWRSLYALAGVAVVLLALAGVTYLAGGRWNTSPSVPLGLYWTIRAPIAKGEFVMVCPPNTPIFQQARERTYLDVGGCPDNYGHMVKQVAATGGDLIAISTAGVAVNGRLLPDSAPIATDPQGRAMPAMLGASYTLASKQLLLMGVGNPLSFDGRYYGPVGEETIVNVLKPVFTWTPKE
jgi:conjugative transfer signal peptidase TraF